MWWEGNLQRQASFDNELFVLAIRDDYLCKEKNITKNY